MRVFFHSFIHSFTCCEVDSVVFILDLVLVSVVSSNVVLALMSANYSGNPCITENPYCLFSNSLEFTN